MPLNRAAIAAAPVVFVLLWSSGFIGARYGLPYIEPMTFLAVRMGCVVVVMLAIALIARARFPELPEIGHSLVAGWLVHGAYLGGVFVAISQGVPAGISALIPGLQPILTSTIANRFMGERVSPLQWLGLALGLVGVLMVLHDHRIVASGSALGWTASFVSLFGITLGTLYQKRYCGGIDWRAGNTVQYIGAGTLFAIASFTFETRVDPLDRRIGFRHRLAGDRAVGAGGGADVLADPPLGGDQLRQPVLSGAGRHRLARLCAVRRAARFSLDRRHGGLRGRRGAGQPRRAGEAGGGERGRVGQCRKLAVGERAIA